MRRTVRRTLAALLALMLVVTVQPSPDAQAQNQSGITSPAPGSSVSDSVPIIGTATIETFQRYELYFKEAHSSDDSYAYFAGATHEVFNGQLGVWHTQDLPPGTYTIRMRVVKQDGNYAEAFAEQLSVNQGPPTPSPTPTPDEPTATPIPVDTPTPVPQPTPAAVQVDQPNLDEPDSENSQTGETPTEESENGEPTAEVIALGGNSDPAAGQQSGDQNEIVASDAAGESAAAAIPEAAEETGFADELGAALALEQLRGRFMTGVRFSAGIFLLLAAVFGGKRLLEWILTKAG